MLRRWLGQRDSYDGEEEQGGMDENAVWLTKVPDGSLLLKVYVAESTMLEGAAQWVVAKRGGGLDLQYYRACPFKRDLHDS